VLRRVAKLAVLCTSMLTGCGAPPIREATLASTAGCYALVRSDSPAVSVGAMMPDTVFLDSTTKRNPDGRPDPSYPHMLRPVSHLRRAWQDSLRLDSVTSVSWPPDWDESFVVMAWRFSPPDSVAGVLHRNMDASWRLRFRIVADSLVGGAEYYDDTDRTYTVPLVGRRVLCRRRAAAEPGVAGDSAPG
jgi:hypothetical protein